MTYNHNAQIPPKWKSFLGSTPSSNWYKTALSQMMQNQLKHFNQLYGRHTQHGPYYCDQNGKFITSDDAANPNYVPYVIFWSDDDAGGKRTWIYDLSAEDFYENEGFRYWPVSREDIPDWIIEEIFKRIPKLYGKDEIGDFTKFAMPLVRKAFPQLISQNLVSVQPMTRPVGGISFYRPRYASGTQKPV